MNFAGFVNSVGSVGLLSAYKSSKTSFSGRSMKNLDLDTNSGTSGSDISLKDIPRSTDAPPESSEPRVRQRNDVRRPDSRHSTMAVETSDQWIFTPEEVMSAPCIVDGLDPVEERCRRAKGVNFITQAGILLKLPQLTIATASIFFHRYFMRQTMVVEKGGAHHYNVAATALFLATKTEENCRKTREIVVAVAKVAQKNSSLVIDEQSKEYWRWRDSILYLEEHMLEMLTFDLVVNTPHINLLGLLETLAIEENKSLRNAAWAFLNDSCMTPLCLMMPGPDITIAAVYFAVKLNNETLPDVDNKPWWLSVGGDPEKIVRAVSVVDQFWTENPLRKSDRPYGSSPSSQDDLERTRRRESNGSSSGDNFSERLRRSYPISHHLPQRAHLIAMTLPLLLRAPVVVVTISLKSYPRVKSIGNCFGFQLTKSLFKILTVLVRRVFLCRVICTSSSIISAFTPTSLVMRPRKLSHLLKYLVLNEPRLLVFFLMPLRF